MDFFKPTKIKVYTFLILVVIYVVAAFILMPCAWGGCEDLLILVILITIIYPIVFLLRSMPFIVILIGVLFYFYLIGCVVDFIVKKKFE